ncbi:MAG TPA: DUF4097 family beta strand repeat-containing protein [Edaphobacter sp.]
MGNVPPPYPPPPPPSGPPYHGDWKYQRRVMKEQARMQRDMLRAQRQAYRYQMRAGRRSSIVGPLLIIAVGIIFLLIQTGRLSVHAFWDWYGRWWPLLLIGAGVLVLLEWTFDQFFHADDTIPRRRSLGGGVFFLLLVFGVAGIVISGLHSGRDFFGRSMTMDDDNFDQFWGDKHESEQALAQALPAGSSILINNPRGDVSVTGTSDDNQVHIAVHKEVFTRSDSEADKKAQQLSPNVATEGSTLSITMPSVEGGRADLIVTIPPAAPATVTANRGDVKAASIKAPVNVTANHGDITIAAITGPVVTHVNNSASSVSVHSVQGPVSVEGHARDLNFSEINGAVTADGEFFGSTHIERIRDAIRFHTSRTDLRLARLDGEAEISPSADLSANQVQGPLTLATRNRNITLDRVSGDISVINRNGSVDLTGAPPLGNITVENRNGSVNLTMPEQAGFVLQAETSNGDASNDFGLDISGEDTNRKTMNGTVGKGGPLVRITTSQADVAVRKAAVAPLPPLPPLPPISIHGPEGSHVIIGKEGVNIQGNDGSAVIIDKNGVNIKANADGSSVYSSKGTRLITNADGSRVYVGADGTRYVRNVDGSRSYTGRDGTHITINADGSKNATDPHGRSLSDAEIDRRLAQAEREADRVAAERDRARNR